MTEVLVDGGVDGNDRAVLGPQEDLLVHRNGALFGAVTLLAAVVAAAYAWRGLQGSVLGWFVVAVLGVVALIHLRAWIDARKPLLVADCRGLRLRLGRSWTGFSWDELDRVVVRPRRHLFGDGSVLVQPRSGAAYEVRVGITSASSREDVGPALAALAAGRTTVHVPDAPPRRPADNQVRPAPPAVVVGQTDEVAQSVGVDHDSMQPAQHFQPHVSDATGAVATNASDNSADPGPQFAPAATPSLRVAHGASPARPDAPSRPRWRLGRAPGGSGPADTDGPADVPTTAAPPAQPPEGDAGPPASEPARPGVAATASAPAGPRRAVRADVRRAGPLSSGALALSPDARRGSSELPEVTELRGTEGRVGLVIEHVASPHPADVTPYAVPTTPAAPDEQPTVSQPVIGPQLAQARGRLRVSVDQLAERTRIRPHVIEAMEVDDFEPCGGDFYARGHLRRLASVLGLDPAPLLELYDARYGQGPIAASKVFQAELATGPGAAVRGTSGGPNWTALLGVVVALLVLWGVARFVTGGEPAVVERPATAVSSSAPAPDPDRFAGVGAPPRAVSVTATADTVVRLQDAEGETIWIGPLQAGESRRWSVTGAVTVRARDASAVTAQLGTEDPVRVGREAVPDEVTLGAG